MTLIELLVVIIILTTIVAAAIPIMAPADEDRRLREASRLLNTFITTAQSRAIALNRPVGIGLKRLSQDTQRPEDRGVCVQVYYVEQQPPYAGFDSNSRARLAFYTPPANLYGGATGLVLIQFLTRESGIGVPVSTDGLPSGWDADLFPTGMMRPGDVIEINGSRFELLADSRDNRVSADFDQNGYFTSNTGRTNANKAAQIVARPLSGLGQMLNMTHDDDGDEIGTTNGNDVPFFTSPTPYKIHRQATTTSDEPFQMPEGTAIDLRASGLGYSDYSFFHWPGTDAGDARVHDNDDPVMVLFTPEGKVSRLRYNLRADANTSDVIFDRPVVDNLFLLVGQRGKIPAPALSRDITLTNSYPPESQKAARERAREPLNWLSGTSRWIVIGSQSGRIATVANTFVDPEAMNNIGALSTFGASSESLRSQQIMAARALTRETTQATAR